MLYKVLQNTVFTGAPVNAAMGKRELLSIQSIYLLFSSGICMSDFMI